MYWYSFLKLKKFFLPFLKKKNILQTRHRYKPSEVCVCVGMGGGIRPHPSDISILLRERMAIYTDILDLSLVLALW